MTAGGNLEGTAEQRRQSTEEGAEQSAQNVYIYMCSGMIALVCRCFDYHTELRVQTTWLKRARANNLARSMWYLGKLQVEAFPKKWLC